ncbi:MAG: ribbon-helix-helix domain-containing protein [Candidatus Jordarchaeales archaeon]
MKSVSFRVPEEYLKGLGVLVELGVFRSRSEAVRAAVRELLRREGVFEDEVAVVVDVD